MEQKYLVPFILFSRTNLTDFVQAFSNNTPINFSPKQSSILFSAEVPVDHYMFLFTPVAYGVPTLNLLMQGCEIEGGWNGATWPDNGEIGDVLGGPLTVVDTTRDNAEWYVFRTDFPGLGSVSHRIIYPSKICELL